MLLLNDLLVRNTWNHSSVVISASHLGGKTPQSQVLACLMRQSGMQPIEKG